MNFIAFFFVLLKIISFVLGEAGTPAPDQSAPVKVDDELPVARHFFRVSSENWFFSYGSFLLTSAMVPIYDSYVQGNFQDPVVLKRHGLQALVFVPLPFYLTVCNSILSKIPFLPKHPNGSFLASRVTGGFADVALFSVFDALIFGWLPSYLPVFLVSWIVVDLFPTKLKFATSLFLALWGCVQNGLELGGKHDLLNPVYGVLEKYGTLLNSKLGPANFIVQYIFNPIYDNWLDFITELPRPDTTPFDYIKYVYRAIYPFAQIFLGLKFTDVKDGYKPVLGLMSIGSENYFGDIEEELLEENELNSESSKLGDSSNISNYPDIADIPEQNEEVMTKKNDTSTQTNSDTSTQTRNDSSPSSQRKPNVRLPKRNEPISSSGRSAHGDFATGGLQTTTGQDPNGEKEPSSAAILSFAGVFVVSFLLV